MGVRIERNIAFFDIDTSYTTEEEVDHFINIIKNHPELREIQIPGYEELTSDQQERLGKKLQWEFGGGPFIEFLNLEPVDKQFKENIAKVEYRSNVEIGGVSRHFNDLIIKDQREYSRIHPLTDCAVEAYLSGEFATWLDLSIAYGIVDVLNKKGNVRFDIFNKLGRDPALMEDTGKINLVSSYVTNIAVSDGQEKLFEYIKGRGEVTEDEIQKLISSVDLTNQEIIDIDDLDETDRFKWLVITKINRIFSKQEPDFLNKVLDRIKEKVQGGNIKSPQLKKLMEEFELNRGYQHYYANEFLEKPQQEKRLKEAITRVNAQMSLRLELKDDVAKLNQVREQIRRLKPKDKAIFSDPVTLENYQDYTDRMLTFILDRMFELSNKKSADKYRQSLVEIADQINDISSKSKSEYMPGILFKTYKKHFEKVSAIGLNSNQYLDRLNTTMDDMQKKGMFGSNVRRNWKRADSITKNTRDLIIEELEKYKTSFGYKSQDRRKEVQDLINKLKATKVGLRNLELKDIINKARLIAMMSDAKADKGAIFQSRNIATSRFHGLLDKVSARLSIYTDRGAEKEELKYDWEDMINMLSVIEKRVTDVKLRTTDHQKLLGYVVTLKKMLETKNMTDIDKIGYVAEFTRNIENNVDVDAIEKNTCLLIGKVIKKHEHIREIVSKFGADVREKKSKTLAEIKLAIQKDLESHQNSFGVKISVELVAKINSAKNLLELLDVMIDAQNVLYKGKVKPGMFSHTQSQERYHVLLNRIQLHLKKTIQGLSFEDLPKPKLSDLKRLINDLGPIRPSEKSLKLRDKLRVIYAIKKQEYNEADIKKLKEFSMFVKDNLYHFGLSFEQYAMLEKVERKCDEIATFYDKRHAVDQQGLFAVRDGKRHNKNSRIRHANNRQKRVS
jgi:hypothetical protein